MDLIGTATAARMLGVSVKTVKRWADDGDTDGVVLPTAGRVDGAGPLLFDRAAVRAYAERRIDVARQRIETAS